MKILGCISGLQIGRERELTVLFPTPRLFPQKLELQAVTKEHGCVDRGQVRRCVKPGSEETSIQCCRCVSGCVLCCSIQDEGILGSPSAHTSWSGAFVCTFGQLPILL